jgi:hypothetical protein
MLSRHQDSRLDRRYDAALGEKKSPGNMLSFRLIHDHPVNIE